MNDRDTAREGMRRIAKTGATTADAIRSAIAHGGFRAAADRDLTRSIARQVGLTDQAATEVIDAWIAHYRTVPFPVNEHVIRVACIIRATGDQWRPNEMPRDWWARR